MWEVRIMNGKRILAINGSYRDDGITDQAVIEILDEAGQLGAEVEHIRLRDYPIEFCYNCRHCMQQPGATPGACVHNDGMADLVDKIEQADGYVLAAPTNFSAVTAVFKRFMERLVVYAYWPEGQPYPRYRKQNAPRKKALLISSSGAPSWLGRLFFQSIRQLKMTAKTIGADPVGSVFTGAIVNDLDHRIPAKIERRTRSLARQLLRS